MMFNRAAALLCDIAGYGNMALSSDATVGEMIEKMFENSKGAVVILGEGDRPVGILTERDAVRMLFEGVDLEKPAIDHAKKSIISALGDRSVGHALNLMLENNIRRLVVVDEMDIFLGLVTQQDLMIHLEEDFYRAAIKARHIRDQLKKLVSSSPSESISSVLEKMVLENVSAVPVLQKGKPVGMVTEMDLLGIVMEGVPFGDKIGLYMSDSVECVEMDDKLVDIVKVLNAMDVRRVVLCDEEGLAVSVITNRDLASNLEGDYSEFLEKKLTYSKEILNLLPEMIMELVDTGEDQLVLWCNDKVAGRFGENIIDSSITRLVPPERWNKICGVLRRQGRVEDVKYKKDGTVYEFSGFYLPLDKPSEMGRIQLIVRDITEEEMLATTDPLTSVYNRRYMNEFLGREIQRSSRMAKEFAVILVDIDDFKKVNDTFGHASGDYVLKTIVGVIMCGTRDYDVVGRYGGEEFLIILPEVDRLDAKLVAERIRSAISEKKFEVIGGEVVKLTASLGGACYGVDGASQDDLLTMADRRMYKAKEAGKNKVVFD